MKVKLTPLPKLAGVYLITNSINGLVYVGSSKNIRTRKQDHIKDLRAKKHASKFLQKDYELHGESSFIFKPIELTSNKSTMHLRELEQKWMDFFKCYERGVGYNLYRSAFGAFGVFLSDITKAKIGAANKGKKRINPSPMKGKNISEETKDKIKKANTGHTTSVETRAKISASNKGRIFPDSWKQNISIGKKGRPVPNMRKPIIQLDMQLKFIKEFESGKAAAKELGGSTGNISSCLKGKLKSTHGSVFMYKSDYEKIKATK